MHAYSARQLALCFSFFLPTTTIEEIGVVSQNDPFYGGHGTWVVNVPQGKMCKVWYGNIPKLLEQGTHVVHDATFRLATESERSPPSNAFVDVSTPQLQHGTIHILRVPVGKIAKVSKSRPKESERGGNDITNPNITVLFLSPLPSFFTGLDGHHPKLALLPRRRQTLRGERPSIPR
jgi:hypothetical protein